MKKKHKLVLLVIGACTLCLGFYWIVSRPKVNNIDAAIIDRFHLEGMADQIIYYFKTSDASAWNSTCQLHDINDVWASMRYGNQKLLDVWGKPYLFEVTGTKEATVIRLVSPGYKPPMFVELKFDGVQRIIGQKRSWDAKVLTTAVPGKNDGWIVVTPAK